MIRDQSESSKISQSQSFSANCYVQNGCTPPHQVGSDRYICELIEARVLCQAID
jgi:hypothetical protein